MSSRRFDGAARAIARLQRRVDGLERLASRRGHGHDALPLGVLGYAEVTSNQTGIGSSPTDVTGLSVTVTPGTGRLLRIGAQILVQEKTSAGTVQIQLHGDGTEIQRIGHYVLAADEIHASYGSVVIEATAGSHTYKVVALSDATVDVLGGSTRPNQILVEDIGAA